MFYFYTPWKYFQRISKWNICLKWNKISFEQRKLIDPVLLFSTLTMYLAKFPICLHFRAEKYVLKVRYKYDGLALMCGTHN